MGDLTEDDFFAKKTPAKVRKEIQRAIGKDAPEAVKSEGDTQLALPFVTQDKALPLFRNFVVPDSYAKVIAKPLRAVLESSAGVIALHTAPTGAGKTYMASKATFDFIEQWLADQKGKFSRAAKTIVFLAPYHSQLSGIEKDLRKQFAERANLQEYVEIISIQAKDKMIKAADTGLPQQCPIVAANKELSKALGRFRDRKDHDDPAREKDVEQELKRLMGKIADGCSSRYRNRKSGCNYAQECNRCAFKNPGQMIWGPVTDDNKQVRIVLMTYDRLYHDFPSIRRDPKTGRLVKKIYQPMVSSPRGVVKNTTFIADEIVVAYKRMWEKVIFNSQGEDEGAEQAQDIPLFGLGIALARVSRNLVKSVYHQFKTEFTALVPDADRIFDEIIQKSITYMEKDLSWFHLKGKDGTKIRPFDGKTPDNIEMLPFDRNNCQVKTMRYPVGPQWNLLACTKGLNERERETESAESVRRDYVAEVVDGAENSYHLLVANAGSFVKKCEHGRVSDAIQYFFEKVVLTTIRFLSLLQSRDLSKIQEALCEKVSTDAARDEIEQLMLDLRDRMQHRLEQDLGDQYAPVALALIDQFRRPVSLAKKGSRRTDGKEDWRLHKYEADVERDFYAAGYTLLDVEYDDDGTERLLPHIHIARCTPEGMLAHLAKTNSICLMSATAEVGSGLSSLNFGFLEKLDGIEVVRFTDEDVQTATDFMVSRALQFSPLNVKGVSLCFSHLEDEGFVPSPSSMAAVTEAQRQMLNNIALTTPNAKDKKAHPGDCALPLVQDIEAHPTRPRFIMLITNRADHAEAVAGAVGKHLAGQNFDVTALAVNSKDIEASLKGVDTNVTARRNLAADKSWEGTTLNKAVGDFQSKLINPQVKKTPILIVAGALNSLSVGLNLQLRYGQEEIRRAVEAGGVLPPLLAAYMGRKIEQFAVYGGGEVQIDMSDVVFAMPTSYLVEDGKHMARQILSLAIREEISWELLFRVLGQEQKGIHALLESTNVLAREQVEIINQTIGRMGRTLNAPDQTLFVHSQVIERLSGADLPEVFRAGRTVMNRQFAEFIGWMMARDHDEMFYGTQQRTVSGDFYSAVANLFHVPNEAAREASRATWTRLREIPAIFQAVTDEFFAGEDAAKLDEAIQRINPHLPESVRLRSARDLYYAVDVDKINSPVVNPIYRKVMPMANELTGVNRRAVALIKATTTHVDGCDQIVRFRSQLTGPFHDAAFEQTWVSSDADLIARLSGKGKKPVERVFVARPRVMKEVVNPTVQEWLTRNDIASALTSFWENYEVDEEMFEFADHKIDEFNALVDNKSIAFHLMSVGSIEDKRRQLVEEGRRRLGVLRERFGIDRYTRYIYVTSQPIYHTTERVLGVPRTDDGTVLVPGAKGCDIIFIRRDSNLSSAIHSLFYDLRQDSEE
jgi:hypothetical protein